MTDFDSLLPPRTAPPRLPSRGGPAAVLDAARSRRRKHATKVVSAGSVATLAFAGLFALRPPAGTHGVDVEPGGSRPPSTPGTAQLHDDRRPTGTKPGSGPTSPRPTGASVPAAGPDAPTVSPTAIPTVLPSVPVLSTSATKPPVRYVNVLRDEVDDRPTEDCALLTSPNSADDVLCVRHEAPIQVPSGTAVDFGYEVCAKTNDVTLYASRQEEYTYRFTRSGLPVWTARERPKEAAGAHEYEIKAGRCIRYTFQWDGRGDDGRPLPIGGYDVEADIPGEWNEQAAGIDSTPHFTVT